MLRYLSYPVNDKKMSRGLENKIELSKIEGYVRNLYENFGRSELLYHNLEHTEQVVKHAVEIAEYYNIDADREFVLLASAWFHDCGHLFGAFELHEEKSVEIMHEYFVGSSIDQDTVLYIEACIMATKMPVYPQNLLEEILCDSDTYHLGTTSFTAIDQFVWNELELRLGLIVECKMEKSIDFLSKHQFFTSYCQQKLGARKTQNLSCLKTSFATCCLK